MSDARAAGPGNNRLAVLAGEIVAAVADIKASAEVIAERALTIGRALIEAKAALPHGQWEPWLRQNVSMSARSARRYMQLAASGIKPATVADLGLRGATEALAGSSRMQERRAADAAATLLREVLTEEQFTSVLKWADKAAKKNPSDPVLATMANEISLAWLERNWQVAPDDVRRAFIDKLIEAKHARWKDGRLVITPAGETGILL